MGCLDSTWQLIGHDHMFGTRDRCRFFHPATHTFSIRNSAELASRVQEHHDQLAPRNFGLHHQALTRFRDVTCLLQANVPLRAFHQAVGVVVLQSAMTHRDLTTG